MAKLSAHGSTVLAKLKFKFVGNGKGAEHTGGVSTFALRSDGAILKKGPSEKRYTLWRRFKPDHRPATAADAAQALRRVLTTFGYEEVAK